MKILVTGGSGFIGSHVADKLSDQGHEVTVFDIKGSPYLRGDQKMIVGDILDKQLIDKIVSENNVVYHFAGIADIDECSKRPVDTAKFNILGTVQLLEACCKSKISRFVFASSAYVYSNSGYFYASSKQACELFIENFYELHGLKYTCLRYGSLYGERADEKNSIYRIIKEAIKEGMITYHGTGDEMREFIHIQDAAQLSVDILDDKFENQHIIITGAEKMRYKDLLNMINEMFNNNLKVRLHSSARKAHYTITPYNFSPKLGRKLINNPHIDMGQGLLLCMAEIYEKVNADKNNEIGFFLKNE